MRLPGPVPSDRQAQSAFQYALGMHSEGKPISFHCMSLRDGVDVCFSAPSGADAEAFVRAVAVEICGYLSARFACPLVEIDMRVMLRRLRGVRAVMNAMALVAVRNKVGASEMLPRMLSDGPGFVEVRTAA